MKALEAFKTAMFYVSGLCSTHTKDKPGAVIERLSSETREALQELKSDDIGSNVILDNVGYYAATNEYYQNKEFEKERLEFDKKILKK